MPPRQDKQTTDRNAKTLRELLKQPDNKVCADCKRNDPRWASWNLGVFVCIRCSGIHRSMGTHISRVKSVDLDVWTPEQMESITSWGNRRANIYWEAHLRVGHVPPDHKIESFIRSKYESKRWAMEGPPPADPATLDAVAPKSAEAPAPAQEPPPPVPASRPTASTLSAAANVPRLPQLLSSARLQQQQQQQNDPAQPQQQQPPPAQPAATDDLFSLDFHAPVGAAAQQQQQPPNKTDVKDQIMSLFGSPPVQQPNAFGANVFGAQPAPAQNQWGQQPQAGGMGMPVGGFGGQLNTQQTWGVPPQQQQPTSMMGNAGVGMWGANSGWNVPPAATATTNIWATPAAPPNPPPQQQPNLFSNDIWSTPIAATPAANPNANTSANGFGAFGSASTQKDDAFADIWGGFK